MKVSADHSTRIDADAPSPVRLRAPRGPHADEPHARFDDALAAESAASHRARATAGAALIVAQMQSAPALERIPSPLRPDSGRVASAQTHSPLDEGAIAVINDLRDGLSRRGAAPQTAAAAYQRASSLSE
jgi:hypothetical protein